MKAGVAAEPGHHGLFLLGLEEELARDLKLSRRVENVAGSRSRQETVTFAASRVGTPATLDSVNACWFTV